MNVENSDCELNLEYLGFQVHLSALLMGFLVEKTTVHVMKSSLAKHHIGISF